MSTKDKGYLRGTVIGPLLHASYEAIEEFCLSSLWLERGLARMTQYGYAGDLRLFAKWLEHDSCKMLFDVSREDIHRYVVESNVMPTTQRRRMAALRGFYGWSLRERRIDEDPCLLMLHPKIPPRRPFPLSVKQVDALLSAPQVDHPRGLRDRALLELLYGSGMRVSEAVGLSALGLDFKQRAIRIIGKGSVERIALFGEEAAFWLERYLRTARPALAMYRADRRLFITRRGDGITSRMVGLLVNRYARQADIRGPLSPHTLRHSFATHMLDNNADLVTIQQLLGHTSISTTEIYTHVAMAKVKKIHEAYHPREHATADISLCRLPTLRRIA
ncbi:tyrosine recombinase [Pandoraea sp.]|uniref:tyrosine recombinase n=1 Tax=Pandoraea sp. TaxID=1883445 RepID=UPI001205CE78|nr:tyrosine recombinase [Pandoraea sp.]TAL52751.1 MAG: tyrosine recombinase [Pandoraea sp.]TAM17727.1 MAG: tyrosine recombinase [Pandoraea sp.]